MKTVPTEWPLEGTGNMAFVGEAPGDVELRTGRPLTGKSGKQYNSLLRVIGVRRTEVTTTNVLDFKLPNNTLKSISVQAKEQKALVAELPEEDQVWKPWLLSAPETGVYIPPEIAIPALKRLRADLEKADPTVVVALGATALWALKPGLKIGSNRGTVIQSDLVPGLKLVPTFHPAYILRQYRTRKIVVSDFMKAKVQSAFREVRLRNREIWIRPTLDDLEAFARKHMPSDGPLSVDIETARGQIECIGFATDRTHAIVVPFVDYDQDDNSYWRTPADEVSAWRWCARWLTDPAVPLLMQNGVYDVQWIYVKTGIPCRNYTEDTRLKHHAKYPELPKGLGFLGSVYEEPAIEGSWKDMTSHKEEKKDA